MYITSIRSNDEFKFKIIPKLLDMGISDFRINFSRGDLSSNLEMISHIRDVEKKRGIKCNIFIDLPGSKIRLGRFEDGFQKLEKGNLFVIDLNYNLSGNTSRVYVKNEIFLSNVREGDLLSTSNELENLKVLSVESTKIKCMVTKNCRLFNFCGISVKDRYIPNESLTEFDMDIVKKIGSSVDYVCPSFIDSPKIIEQLRNMGIPKNMKIIAKVESPYGVKFLNEIIQISDGVMLCRGDLKNFYLINEMQQIGDNMLKIGKLKGKIVVFATDYFLSMINGGKLSETDASILIESLSKSPNYLLINETTRSKNWLEIVNTALKHKRNIK